VTDKLDPLPWFALNVGEYLKDTMRLTRDAHGAYFLLILDYYGTAKPCPDDDFILAALTKSTEAEWKQIRKMLAPFFDIREGYWYHRRIERELREACAKHALAKENARTAALAMHAARRAKHPDQAETSPKPHKSARRNASAVRMALPPAVQTAMQEQSDSLVQKQKHPLITGGGEAPPAPEVDDLDSVGTPISKDFTPDPATSDRARAYGLSVAEIDAEVRKFIGTRQADGSFSNDWQGSFAVWIEREIQHRAKQKPKAPPRIEVNAAPTDAEYDRGCEQFRKGQQWSRQLGPDPDSGGCRVPLAILEKHGLRKARAS
jgi:uncharacterized protein YdaU (DUF1376 family)